MYMECFKQKLGQRRFDAFRSHLGPCVAPVGFSIHTESRLAWYGPWKWAAKNFQDL